MMLGNCYHLLSHKSSSSAFLKGNSEYQVLARLGVALIGDTDAHNSNFIQLLHLLSIDDPSILQYMQKKLINIVGIRYKMNYFKF